jgi:predicted ribosome quality control (RQC) complex YloA/Tae2 family protein
VKQRELEKKFTKVEKEKTSVGLTFKSTIFTLLVGRNSKENDQLLRKSVRGNDWWLHLRDHPGAYVFIKNIPNKSVPKETIIDAANLAIFYSKGSKGVTYDLYYTQVKYLKRVKGDKLGLVIPTMEKNIIAKIDEKRLNRLFATKG